MSHPRPGVRVALALCLALSLRPSGASAAEVLIDFDDVVAPCRFDDTRALRDEYLDRGVRFRGAGPLDGGAVLHWCSAFSVTGYSGTNFLAFFTGGEYFGGGLEQYPETIEFVQPVVSVRMLVGSGIHPGTASMTAYDADGQVVGLAARAVAPTLAPLSVSAADIRRVVLQGTSFTAVWDDLRFTPSGVVPIAPSSWGRLKAMYR